MASQKKPKFDSYSPFKMVYDEIWVSSLTDAELYRQLKALGFDIGPVVINTRKVYERKLLRALNNSSPEQFGNPELVGGDASSSVSNTREDRADHSYSGSGDQGRSLQPPPSLVRGVMTRSSGVSPPGQSTNRPTTLPWQQQQQQERFSQDIEEYVINDDDVGGGSRVNLERTGGYERPHDVESVAREAGSSGQSIVASRSWSSTVTSSYPAPATSKATTAASSSFARSSASDYDDHMRRACDQASTHAEGQSLFGQIDINQFRRRPLHDRPRPEPDQKLSLIRRFRQFEQQQREFELQGLSGCYSSDESPERFGGRPMIERPAGAAASPAPIAPGFGIPYWYIELFVLAMIMLWLFGALVYMYLYPKDGLHLFAEVQFEKEMFVIMALINVIVQRQFNDDR
ncbi:hypothetical protein HELRODRAFT_189549 [Helobdella robusta]|uniref:LEM domain-containing protein n=1 Tax=Helobdella robusta TaxID=6412 RepID=T1FR51_HELRO|nr:hypothetical protein HELRODRAFT_189549 [Helobdella robusta]ESN92646.1 hypothetical protein HELRODRAFT_189549 [Helobdella robusta]